MFILIILRRIPLFLIIIIGTFFYYNYFKQYPDPPGADGYFYLVQIKSLVQGNGFYYPDRSPAFFIPMLLFQIFNDILNSFRFSIACCFFLLIAIISSLVYKLSRSLQVSENEGYFFSIATFILLVSSINLNELALNYFKNLTGLVITALGIYIYDDDSNKRKFCTILLFITALFFHKSMLLIIFLLFILYVFNTIKEKKSKFNIFILISIPILTCIIFLILYEKSYFYLIHLITYFDWPGNWFIWIYFKIITDIHYIFEIIIILLSLIIYFMNRKAMPKKIKLLLDFMALLLILAIMPFQKAGPTTIGYRLFLMAPIFSIPLFFLSSTLSTKKIYINIIIISLYLVCSILYGIDIFDKTEYKRYFPEWSTYDSDTNKLKNIIKPEDLLIAHHGLKFYITYKTGIRTTEYLPTVYQNNIYRLAYIPEGRPGGRERELLQSKQLLQFGNDYALFHESAWEHITKQINLKPHWKNPAATKPDHIY